MEDFSAWIGRSETRYDIATAAPQVGLAALLDHDTAPPETVPPLGHWLYFLPCARQSAIGDDGHPRRDDDGLLPPVPLPRRMWAGGRVEFLAPIAVGAALTRVTTIAAIRAKCGASGDLLFVTLQHDIAADGTPAIREEQDLVYRAPAAALAPAVSPTPVEPEPADAVRRVTSDPVLLFRYSALTFNAHRIHYDRDYARNVEGYSGLVVQGPLIATLLIDHARREMPGLTPARFSFRAEAPLIDGAPFDLCLTRQGGGARLWTRDASGRPTMQAEVVP
ncbi:MULTISPECIES: MaoC family dehydratase N-terminal domain-containing protein [unclassified Sphingopyxis]|uniref:FAS1-like dehydratase domain-containing protein n=1 Tax=unclassified Sphingopyxis TaxID=2614943 RepID=UPI00285E185F|nr:MULTISPECIES: MaoC family dehydratase N-terminal domain-containing protein [unclassified Sphingopyxis]MDR6832536.1 3-methylfumaryl-CoA hydratase [Sphingopyxis sp. BE122]MDR7228279.1 3-methylfumaryl-CoA hydratase [Sphingopyxis sp. BE259]